MIFCKKKDPEGSLSLELGIFENSGVEQKIREESVPLDQDSCSGCEPDGCNDWSGSKKLVHWFGKQSLKSFESAW